MYLKENIEYYIYLFIVSDIIWYNLLLIKKYLLYSRHFYINIIEFIIKYINETKIKIQIRQNEIA